MGSEKIQEVIFRPPIAEKTIGNEIGDFHYIFIEPCLIEVR